VASIVPTVDRAKATVMTKVRFEQIDPRVLPEMSAKVFFLSQRPSDADQQPVLAVPTKALDGARLWVIQKDGDKETVRPVTIQKGRQLGELLEVQAQGLKSGDRLVANPANLREGQRVKVVGK
jgi:HlyD family secretion protein